LTVVTFSDSMILRHLNPLCLGVITLDSGSVGVVFCLLINLGGILSHIIWVCDGDGFILLYNLSLGDIVGIGLDVDIGDMVGQGVLLGLLLGDVFSLGFGEVMLGRGVSILGLLVVVMTGDYLGVIEQLSLSLNLRLSVGSHSGVEDDSLGCHHGLSDGGIDCFVIFLVLGSIVIFRGLDILSHGFGMDLGVALGLFVGGWGIIAYWWRGITYRPLVRQPRN